MPNKEERRKLKRWCSKHQRVHEENVFHKSCRFPNKKKKKSLVGYGDETTWDNFCFRGEHLPCLYLTSKPTYKFQDIVINPKKYRITIEEI